MKIRFLASLFITVMVAVLLAGAYQSRAQGVPQRIEIVAQRFNFTPGEITLKRGVPVVFVLTSKDVNHGLKFKELNLNINIKKGQVSEVPFTPAQAGNFIGQCSSFCGSGHGSMKLTLHVLE